jgi:hypothetical protein
MDNTPRVVRGNPVGFCGYKADPKVCGYKSYEDHPSCGSALPDEVDLSQWVPSPWNQGLTASGVAHAFAGALTVALAAHSRALSSPAWPRGIYYATRLAVLNSSSSPSSPSSSAQVTGASGKPLGKTTSTSKIAPPTISDVGTSPWWTIHVLRALGIPTCRAETLDVDVRGQEYADFLLAKINEAPSDLGLVNSPLDFHAIAEGMAKVDQVVSALATGYPILGATDTTHPKFQSYNGTGVIDSELPTKPGQIVYVPDQMIYIAAVRKGETGREFKIVNSWGWREWTHDSAAWVTERFVATAISNLLVPRVL